MNRRSNRFALAIRTALGAAAIAAGCALSTWAADPHGLDFDRMMAANHATRAIRAYAELTGITVASAQDLTAAERKAADAKVQADMATLAHDKETTCYLEGFAICGCVCCWCIGVVLLLGPAGFAIRSLKAAMVKSAQAPTLVHRPISSTIPTCPDSRRWLIDTTTFPIPPAMGGPANARAC